MTKVETVISLPPRKVGITIPDIAKALRISTIATRSAGRELRRTGPIAVT